MICSSENRFFTSNLRRLGDWTPNRRATQNRGDVAHTASTQTRPLGVSEAVGHLDRAGPGYSTAKRSFTITWSRP